MGVYTGLDAIKKYKEDIAARREAAEAAKIEWFSNLVKDGEQVKVRFLQEMDPGAENYSEKNGLGVMVTEHSNPKNWQRKALCTAEEGACLGCEKHREDWKAGWRQKPRLIINVLVENKKGDRTVAVMSQSNGTKAILAPMILDYAVENNTITDRWWKITRNGEKTDTTWTPMVLNPTDDVDVEEYDVYDLAKAYRAVPYDEQFDFYFKDESAPAERDEPEAKSDKTSTDEEW
jgi:hypothetical protein